MKTAKELWKEAAVTGLGIDRVTKQDIVLRIQNIRVQMEGTFPPLMRKGVVFVIYVKDEPIETGLFFQVHEQALAWFERMTGTNNRMGCPGMSLDEVIGYIPIVEVA